MRVAAYSIEEFRRLLEEYSEASAGEIETKLHSRYFEEYFAETGVQTIVVEEDYVDRDYLDDFAAYYVRCFHQYRRTCARLHFFCNRFTEGELSDLLQGTGPLDAKILKREYAGFVVVRPLPSSVIGRSALKTYPANSTRLFPVAFATHANLFGIELTVKALPFQEQDRVTAACATSALWSAFQATARMFQHHLPSPVEITRNATEQMPVRSRTFPNADGLAVEQMAHAVRNLGLAPYLIELDTEDGAAVLRDAVRAYLPAGIPGLLVFDLTQESGGARELIGTHAVTVTGFNIPEAPSSPDKDFDFLSTSDRINKLYVHDDQVGPHARMEFETDGGEWWLSTSWGLDNGYTDVRAKPIFLLLPLYNKIRIPFTDPLQDVMAFDRALELFASAVPCLKSKPLWTLRLVTVNELKSQILASTKAAGPLKRRLLTESLPRFLWHASASNEHGLVADILFDATDIDSGRYVRSVDIHDTLLRAAVNHVWQNSTGRVRDELGAILSKRNVDAEGALMPDGLPQ